MTDPQLFLDGLIFPEGPRWHRNALWISDILGHRVLSCSGQGAIESVTAFDDRPSGLGFLPDGSPLVALMRSRRLARIGLDGVSEHADLSVLGGIRINDMIVDARGNAYVGNIGVRTSTMAAGFSPDTLVLVLPDGSVRTVAENMWGPNGPAITGKGKILLVAESFANRITAFTIEDDGSLIDRRIFAALPALPDGICLDAEGAVWVGTAFEKEFLRVREGGEVLERIPLSEGQAALACVLGGPDRKTLFLLTSTIRLDEFRALTDFDADSKCTAQGSVYSVKVAVPGIGLP